MVRETGLQGGAWYVKNKSQLSFCEEGNKNDWTKAKANSGLGVFEISAGV